MIYMSSFLDKTSFWGKSILYERKFTAQKYLLNEMRNDEIVRADSDCGTGSCSGSGCSGASCGSCAAASCGRCASAE
jgi:hypothetical protein